MVFHGSGLHPILLPPPRQDGARLHAARFESVGAVPGHDRIADGLAAVTGMIRAETADTLWSLGLGAEAGKYRQRVLRVRASWSLRG